MTGASRVPDKARQSKQINMSEGPIARQLVLFSLPLLGGDLLQLLYNTADMLIVGRFVGKEALAAVGSTGTTINVFIAFFSGVSLGATVLISRAYGAKDRDDLQKAVRTTVWLSLVSGILITLLAVMLTPAMLRLLKTTDDVLQDATDYLRIYFMGTLAQVFYNIFAGILRAVGDSRRPMYVLGLSTVLNIGFDLLLITQFGMGVRGAALATVAAQLICALILMRLLYTIPEFHPLSLRKPCFDVRSLRIIARVGLPFAIQKAGIAFSNTIVLSFINYFGSSAMAGWSIYGKIDQITILATQSISSAITTFDSQNLGAGKPERVHRGNMTGIWLNVAVWSVMMACVLPFRRGIISLFNTDARVIYYGAKICIPMMTLHIINTVSHAYFGMLRGQGHGTAPTVISLFSLVVVHQIYLQVGWNFTKSFDFVIMGFPLAWVFSLGLTLGYIAIVKRRDKKLII